MLKLRKGSKVPFPELLSEGYEYNEPCFTANVNADKIEKLLTHFLAIHNEPVFFILELPSKLDVKTEAPCGEVKALYKDVYYIDGCTQEIALEILNSVFGILINDGMCSFGFGCHRSHDEIMVGKYNVVSIYTQNKNTFDGFFEEHEIPSVKKLITAWSTFTKDSPGRSGSIDTAGKDVYDIPYILKDKGIYFAEKREE